MLYTDNPTAAEEVCGRLAHLSRAAPIIAQVTPGIGTPVGPNAVGVAAATTNG